MKKHHTLFRAPFLFAAIGLLASSPFSSARTLDDLWDGLLGDFGDLGPNDPLDNYDKVFHGGTSSATRVISLDPFMGGVAGWSGSQTGGDWEETDWYNDGNWLGGTPDAGDVVIIDSLNRFPTVLGPGYQDPGGIVVSKEPAKAYALHIGGAGSGHLVIDNYGRFEVGKGGLALGTGESDIQGSIFLADHSSLFVGGNYAVIGSRSRGSLLLHEGSEVEIAASADFHVGAHAGSHGAIRVEGSTLKVLSRTYLGGEGTGVLSVHNEGTATFYKDVYVGTVFGGSGELFVGHETNGIVLAAGFSGNSTVSAYANLEIGVFGQGSAWVDNGSSVNVSLDTIVGSESSGVGSLTLSGTGTNWHTSRNLTVGLLGKGTMTVSDGARISSLSSSNIALYGGSGGSSVTVTGEGAQWIVGTDPSHPADLGIGGQDEGTLTVSDGGQVKVSGAVSLGNISGSGIATVTGAGSLFEAGALLQVGKNGAGDLTISNGGEVVAKTAATIGANGSSDSIVTVTGEGSRWSVGTNLVVSNVAGGSLVIQAGGRVEVGGGLSIGDGENGDGFIGLTGTGSLFSATDGMQVGTSGTGVVLIFDGGRMETDGDSVIGVESGSNGHVGMSVAGSSLISGGELRIGAGGVGKLAINNGAFVSAASVDLGTNDGAAGAIELSGSSGHRATIATGHLARGSGSGTIQFDGGVLRATENRSDFISNFEAGDIQILSGGAFLDTQEFTAGVSAVLQGAGGLNKLGTGRLELSGASTYTGLTAIQDGTLKLDATGSIDNTSGVSLGTDGTFDVSAKTGGYTVRKLSGSGKVTGALTVSTELAIGNSPGTVDFDDLALGSSTTFTYELAGGGVDADLGNVSGTLDLGNSILDLVQLGTYTVGDKFTLFAYNDDSLIGTFAGLVDGATFDDAGGLWQIRYSDTLAGINGGIGSSFVTVTAIPEPGVALLCCLGAFSFLGRRRD